MMKIMKNIMIVSFLIMLQMQSVYCAVPLSCEASDISWECFERKHYQLNDSTEDVIDALEYLKDQSDLLSGMDVTGIECIEKKAKDDPELKRFLNFRGRVLGCAKEMLPQFQKVQKERKTAFVELRTLLSMEDQCIATRTKQDPRVSMPFKFREEERYPDCTPWVDLLQAITGRRCKSVQDACEKVLQYLKNNETLQIEQKQYIDKVVAMPVDVASDTHQRYTGIIEKFQCYLQFIKSDEELCKTCYGEFEKLWEGEKGLEAQLKGVLKVQEEENRISLFLARQKYVGVIYGIGFLVLFCHLYKYMFL